MGLLNCSFIEYVLPQLYYQVEFWTFVMVIVSTSYCDQIRSHLLNKSYVKMLGHKMITLG